MRSGHRLFGELAESALAQSRSNLDSELLCFLSALGVGSLVRQPPGSEGGWTARRSLLFLYRRHLVDAAKAGVALGRSDAMSVTRSLAHEPVPEGLVAEELALRGIFRAGNLDRALARLTPSPNSLGVRSARLLAEACGFGSLISEHVGIVAVVADDGLRSWSEPSLPGIVFTAPFGRVERLADALIHEAAHLFLHALWPKDFSLPPDSSFYSPWRGTRRPAYGFIQGVFSFSVLTHYYASLRQVSDCREACAWAEGEEHKQRARLSAAGSDVEQAASLLPRDAVARAVFEDAYYAAIGEDTARRTAAAVGK